MPRHAHEIDALKTKLLEIQHIRDAAALLAWDQETQMPAGGGQARAGHLATLRTLAHDKFISADFEALLRRAMDDPATDPATDPTHHATEPDDDDAQALLRETWIDFTNARTLPSEFVNRLEHACSLARQV